MSYEENTVQYREEMASKDQYVCDMRRRIHVI